MILPIPHMAPPHRVSNRATSGTWLLFSLPIRAKPLAATNKPIRLAGRRRSPRNNAAKPKVKKA
ncbi:hypothetical protein D3C80_2015180 [compost metagenome]